MTNSKEDRRGKLVVGVTVGTSAFALLRGQLEWFRLAGWEVTLVSSPDEKARLAAEREKVNFHGIAMKRGISPFRDLQALWQWMRFLRKYKPNAVNVGTPKAALLGILASWIMRVPRRLYVVRGLRLEGTTGPLYCLLWAMEWLTMKLATDVVYVSHSLADEAQSRGLAEPRKSQIIGAGSSNGVDAKAVLKAAGSTTRFEVRDGLGIQQSALLVGFIGRVSRDKGADTLVQAIESRDLTPNVQLLIVGSIEEPEYNQAFKSLGDKVVMVPWSNEVWELLSAMDVLCLPTRREGFPNVVLEAAAVGIPTITTNATGAVDSVIDGTTGYIIPVGDHQALVEKINYLDSKPMLLRDLGIAAQKRVESEFKQERIWRGLENVLLG